MHIHVLMLFRKFEHIPIKIGFFTIFEKLLQKSCTCTVLYYSACQLMKLMLFSSFTLFHSTMCYKSKSILLFHFTYEIISIYNNPVIYL